MHFESFSLQFYQNYSHQYLIEKCFTFCRPPSKLCANGAPDSSYPDCCTNGGRGQYCCVNGASNPDCCANGGSGKNL